MTENTPDFISQETGDAIRNVLTNYVSDGMGKRINSDIIQMAGKSGVCRLPNNEYVAAFCAYFPVHKPRYTVLVCMQKRGLPASGIIFAGNVVKQIAEYLIKTE